VIERYSYIQSKLGGIGRFQLTGTNTIRYIIGDIKGIQLFINLIHGKLLAQHYLKIKDLMI